MNADGKIGEVTGGTILEQALQNHPSSPLLFVALLALTCLLPGEAVEAGDDSVRRVASSRREHAYDR